MISQHDADALLHNSMQAAETIIGILAVEHLDPVLEIYFILLPQASGSMLNHLRNDIADDLSCAQSA